MTADTRLRAAAFLDRDGVINVDHGYTHRAEDLAFTPTAAAAILRLNRAGYHTIVVTNQSGIARGLFGLDDVERFHDEMQRRLALSGAHIDAFYVAPYHPDGTVTRYAIDHPDRKPGAGMILRALADWPIDPAASFLIGDKASDMAAARLADVRGVLVPANTCDLDRVVADLLRDAPPPLPSPISS